MRSLRLWLLLAASAATGCAQIPREPLVHQPMTARADTMAMAVLGAIPLVALFLLFQRNIVEGIAGTGIKG